MLRFSLTARRALSLACLVVLFLVLLPQLARGHGQRLPLANWGAFSPDVARCQRVITRAAALCAHTVWSAQHACYGALLRGGACDRDATTSVVQTARRDAQNATDLACSEQQAGSLQYLGLFDLRADLVNFCRAWETAAVSAVYGTMSVGTDISPVNSTARACVEAAADATTTLMQFAFRERRRCFDRIAARSFSVESKVQQLDGSEQRLMDARRAVARRLTARCAPAQFLVVYHRSAEIFLQGIANQLQCLAGQFYVQDAVRCVPAICGNWIVEPGEECDDGNTTAGDGCSSSCAQE